MAVIHTTYPMWHRTPEPDPDVAALALGLAYALLRDRQYKMGREMLGYAMSQLEPQGIHETLRRVYLEQSEAILSAITPFTAQPPKTAT